MSDFAKTEAEFAALEREGGPRRVPCRVCGATTRLTPYAITVALLVSGIAASRCMEPPREMELVACGPCAGLHRSLWDSDELAREALGKSGGTR